LQDKIKFMRKWINKLGRMAGFLSIIFQTPEKTKAIIKMALF